MRHAPVSLATRLIETWAAQGRDGFLLTDPARAEISTRLARDEMSGVCFQFRWMPHREIRGDVGELERRGILNPDRDEEALFRDPRDAKGRHCFLCRGNIERCHPLERLVPLVLAGRAYYAGANFAWIEPDHFTVMSAVHMDQAYCWHVIDAMHDLHGRTDGRFRVLFNGPGAGASIPWHLHFQITTAALPVEALRDGNVSRYPAAVRRFELDGPPALDAVHAFAQGWLEEDPVHHSLNVVVAGRPDEAAAYVFPRDQRRATAEGKGLVGGFEVAGDFVLSAPDERRTFELASANAARSILEQIRPPALSAEPAAGADQ